MVNYLSCIKEKGVCKIFAVYHNSTWQLFLYYKISFIIAYLLYWFMISIKMTKDCESTTFSLFFMVYAGRRKPVFILVNLKYHGASSALDMINIDRQLIQSFSRIKLHTKKESRNIFFFIFNLKKLSRFWGKFSSTALVITYKHVLCQILLCTNAVLDNWSQNRDIFH